MRGTCCSFEKTRSRQDANLTSIECACRVEIFVQQLFQFPIRSATCSVRRLFPVSHQTPTRSQQTKLPQINK